MKALLILFSAVLLTHAIPARSEEATFDVSYYYYEEPNFMNTRSDPVFVSLGVRRWEPIYESWRFLYTAEVTGGPTHYSGSGTMDSVYYKFRGEAYASYRFQDISPIVGLGYRWLYDDSGGQLTSTGYAGYDRQSQYFYIPLGFLYQVSENLQFKGQYNLFIFGIQDSFLSDVQGYSDVQNEQHSGWGVDVALTYKLSEHFGVYSFFRYWHIDDSEISTGTFNNAATFYAYEPSNRTTEAGVGVSYRF